MNTYDLFFFKFASFEKEESKQRGSLLIVLN